MSPVMVRITSTTLIMAAPVIAAIAGVNRLEMMSMAFAIFPLPFPLPPFFKSACSTISTLPPSSPVI